MSATENKKLLQAIFAELSEGNSRLFVESMDDDFRWIVMGHTQWSRAYEGKQTVLNDLFGALRARIGDKITITAQRFIAEDDLVVVEAQGSNTTKTGEPYNNSYCFVFRIGDGRLKEVTEYLDTELVTSALVNPFEKEVTDG